MYSYTIDEKIYNQEMMNRKQIVHRLREIQNSHEYRAGKRISDLMYAIKSGPIAFTKMIKDKIVNLQGNYKIRKYAKPIKIREENTEKANYFSDYKIAVYTCIFGSFDNLRSPLCQPDNIDYYIITDQLFESSTWKKVDITPYLSELDGLNPIEKNRWFKMHPDVVFPEYRYSIYIDGNVLPLTDFTEFINRIKNSGIAMFWHSYNNCVYQEALYNKYVVRKTSDEAIERQIDFLRKKHMPEDYGMTTCNVIARDHQNPICKKLMEDWWHIFINTSAKRDQLSFPYVAWMNSVSMSDVATLGPDVWATDCLLVLKHGE